MCELLFPAIHIISAIADGYNLEIITVIYVTADVAAVLLCFYVYSIHNDFFLHISV